MPGINPVEVSQRVVDAINPPDKQKLMLPEEQMQVPPDPKAIEIQAKIEMEGIRLEMEQAAFDAARDRLEREVQITEELEKQADLKSDLAQKEAELANEQQRRVEDEAADAARKAFETAKDNLESRRALGAAGSKELADADKREKDRARRVEKVKQARKELNLDDGQHDIEAGGKLDEQGLAEQERFIGIMRTLGLKNRGGKETAPEDLEREAKKQGRPLNQKDLELVRRAGAKAQEAELAKLAEHWANVQKAGEDQDRKMREETQARDIAKSRAHLQEIAGKIDKLGAVI
jgi:hypothetical protein